MSICRAQLSNTSNALIRLRISGEQIRLQVPPKLFGVNSWIAQMIRQWIPDCWSGDIKCTGPKSTAANSRNWLLMTSGRSQMLASGDQELRRWAHSSRRGTMKLGAVERWTVTVSLYYDVLDVLEDQKWTSFRKYHITGRQTDISKFTMPLRG